MRCPGNDLSGASRWRRPSTGRETTRLTRSRPGLPSRAKTLTLEARLGRSFTEAKFARNASLERVLRQATVDLNGTQTGHLDHSLQTLGEEPIALQQVAQGALR